jgi:Zn-dependent peptidase ImmA (M78 family)
MGINHQLYNGPSIERKEELAELSNYIVVEQKQNIPIDLESIAKQSNITISYGKYKDAFDGLLECSHRRFHIYCNLDRLESKKNPRTRFTLAHELGHFYIPEHRTALLSGKITGHGSFAEYSSGNPVEKEADFFAACLLMPMEQFIKASKKIVVGLPAIQKLSGLFGTSIVSTAIRYVDADILPCCVVKWTPEGYQWKWLSNKIRQANYRKTIETPASIIPGSATAKALAGEKVPENGFFQTGTTADAWFPFVFPESYKNIIFIEQAMPLGRFGVVTFIYPDLETQ